MREKLFSAELNSTIFKIRILLIILIGSFVMVSTLKTSAQTKPPVLEFPQVGLDDFSTYKGYTTRFFKDSEGSTIQISLNENNGRIVHIWADAANESIAFTARDVSGQPAKIHWLSEDAKIYSEGQSRFVQYTLSSESSIFEIGHFLLGTMRIERDYQYFKRHLEPFNAEPFIDEGLIELIGNLKKLSPEVRQRHFSLLKAKNLEELDKRLTPNISSANTETEFIVRIEQMTLDGKNKLFLEISVDRKNAGINLDQNKILVGAIPGQKAQFRVKVGTNSSSLHPLTRNDIFNQKFFQFYENVKAEYNDLISSHENSETDITTENRWQGFERLERQVKSMELMSSKEKLLAGLPNYATYFGRDMMMSALMLEPVLKPEMLEHVIASVLRKLKPSGEVSHEEGLGGQAIRENAAKYNKLITTYLQQNLQGENPQANKTLAEAEEILANLQAVTENYHMVDDDFQLPVLAEHYLANSEIPADRKRAFLEAAFREGNETSRLAMLIRNLIFVAKVSQPYVQQPVPENLISFEQVGDHHWHAGSWRDSRVGYGNGRFAMDINVIWVPKALESIEGIFATLYEIGFSPENIKAATPKLNESNLAEYLNNSESLQTAIKTWRNAIEHFKVRLQPKEAQQRLTAKLDWWPKEERDYWSAAIQKSDAEEHVVEFLAISLDEKGQPIPVVHTDIATWLFLEDLTGQILEGQMRPETVIKQLEMFNTNYPVGLFLDAVGPVVANDVYAGTQVWEGFKEDLYHSPRVIWGREVNLLFLGLAKQIQAAYNAEGQLKDTILAPYVYILRSTLDKTLAAVIASGLKHNELWSYKIENGELVPARYATTTDIQLWNLTELAVQYLLEEINVE